MRTKPQYFILRERTPVPCDDLILWAMWFEDADRSVAEDMMGTVHISTVFLGLDHGYGGPPVLYETMIFGGSHDGLQWRCDTWDGALDWHKLAVEIVQAEFDKLER